MLSFITTIIDTCLLYLFFFIMMNKRRFQKKAFIFDLLIIFLVQILYNLISSPLTGNISTEATVFRMLLNFVLDFLLSYLFLTKIWVRLVTVILYLVFLTLSEPLAMYVIEHFIDVSISGEVVPDIVFDTIPALMNIFVLLFICITTFISHTRNNTNLGIYTILLLVTPVLSLCLCILPDIFALSITAPTTYYILVYSLIFINVINYILLQNRIIAVQLSEQSKQQAYQLQYQQQKYEQLSNSYRNIRAFMHDTKKHLRYIEHCVKEKEYEKIIPYANETEQDLEKRYCTVNTGNLSIDTFISNLLIQAKEQEIKVETSIKVDTKKIPVRDYDLAIILGNLIDNALNACHSHEKDSIRIVIVTLDDNLTVYMENSYHPTRKITDITSELTHGYGLQNIEKTVHAYEGFCVYHTTQTVFSINIIIPRTRPVDDLLPTPLY